MKTIIYNFVKLSLSILFLILSLNIFAQLQGSGTQEDPYRIYTKSDLESIIDHDTNGKYYELMNDITDSITQKIHENFYGSFNGKGHNLVLNTTETLFKNLWSGSRIDSLSVSGYLFANNIMHIAPFANANFGTINYCINNLDEGSLCAIGICRMNLAHAVVENCVNNYNFVASDLTPFIDYGGIAQQSSGIIRNCVNNGDITILANNKNFGGIVSHSNGSDKILNCINNGTVTQASYGEGMHVGGIARVAYGTIENCINNASFICKNALRIGGIAGDTFFAIIKNSANYGDIYGTAVYAGGIATWACRDSIINCLNAGNIKTFYQGEPTGVGITNTKKQCCYGSKNIETVLGENDIEINNAKAARDSIYIWNCLNTGTCNLTSMNGDYDTYDILENEIIKNNYYDKQISLSKGIMKLHDYGYHCFDSINLAEGKLTTQLTGTSPELQAMLGDGWSYAEGRYPIPLGLENDSMALVAATPIYLHFENEDDYNHVDSVSKNFYVTTEFEALDTIVYPTWEEAFGRVSFNDENVQLLSIGYEILTVKLGNYSKKINIMIVDTEVSSPEIASNPEISIYPNPVSEYINIELNQYLSDEVQIYDISGKLLISKAINSNHTQINIADLEQGMYILNVLKSDRKIASLRFVKE